MEHRNYRASPRENYSQYFSKKLTPSDIRTHGGFSIPKRHANDGCLPLLVGILVHSCSKHLVSKSLSDLSKGNIVLLSLCILWQDMSQQIPQQELVANDLHGHPWYFRHVFRGTFLSFSSTNLTLFKPSDLSIVMISSCQNEI